MTKRTDVWNWLKEVGGKTSAEVRAHFGMPVNRGIRVLIEMKNQGYLTREEAGLNERNLMTYRYFINPDCPPSGRGKYERKPRIAVRVVGERRYKRRKVQTASKRRQAMARNRFETQPIVRLP